MFKIYSIFEIFYLGWPLATSRPLFSKSWRQERILLYNLPNLNKFRNLTVNDPKFVLTGTYFEV